jgi:2-methylcitrate dehydratase PrpD
VPPAASLTARFVRAALEGYDADEARRAGSRALFDHLACLTAGRRGPAVLGEAAAAAFHDRDDIHWPSLTHPGAIIWTVVLSAGAQGERRWRAAHAGYEVTCRLGRALGTEHRRYWHATATAGTVGGAVAAALALETDPVAAAGHAISVAGGSIVALLERSRTGLLHRDHAVDAALRCARVASALSATEAGLEHPRGLFAAMGGSVETLLQPTEHCALAQTSFRRHATSGFCQAVVEAAREHDRVDPQSAVAIAVELPAATLAMVADPEPADADAAWWSCQHAVAVTLLGLDLEDEALVADARVIALRGRITVAEGPVSAVTVGARRTECSLPAELSDADLLAKWHTLNPEVDPPVELLT